MTPNEESVGPTARTYHERSALGCVKLMSTRGAMIIRSMFAGGFTYASVFRISWGFQALPWALAVGMALSAFAAQVLMTEAYGALSVAEAAAYWTRDEFEAEGLAAVCVQHELDHLLGKVFVEYLSPLKRDRIKSKMIKRAREEAVPLR